MLSYTDVNPCFPTLPHQYFDKRRLGNDLVQSAVYFDEYTV
jgi:hypothetical protein